MQAKFLLLCLLLISLEVHSQSMPHEELLCSLDLDLHESSGLLQWNDSTWITINDGGGKSELYFFDGRSGEIVRIAKLIRASNIDWEALAFGPNGDLYVGDFGNNLNRRRDLCIYRISSKQLEEKSLSPEVISFRFSGQREFPPSLNAWHYDIEAMVVMEDFIYLFSKNRARPFNGYVYVYQLPNSVGEQQAEVIDSLFLGLDGVREEFWISAADFIRDEATLLLLSYQRLFVIKGWPAASLSDSQMEQYRFSALRQRESLVSRGRFVYLTEEANSDHRAHFYRVDLRADTMYLFENQVDTAVRIKGFSSLPARLGFEIFDQLGKRVKYGLENDTIHGRFFRRFDIGDLPPSEYVLFIRLAEHKRAFRFSNRPQNQSRDKDRPAPPGKK